MTETGHTLKGFIKKVLKEEIKKIQQEEKHYFLSFGLISQGIEFLGACLDKNDFHKRDESGTRFRLAIKELFPIQYHQFNNKQNCHDLFSNLRCGLLHVLVPKNSIELIQEAEKEEFAGHLEIKLVRGTDRLILVAQDLFLDFENACNKVIQKIDTGEISGDKITGKIIETTI